MYHGGIYIIIYNIYIILCLVLKKSAKKIGLQINTEKTKIIILIDSEEDPYRN